MKADEFFNIVKAQRAAAMEFAATHSPKSRDEYFHLSDQIDAEIARVDKIMEERRCKENTTPTDGSTQS